MWKVVQYEEKYLEPLMKMIKENYGNIEIADKEFIMHQYFNNPNGDANIFLAIDNDLGLAGQYSVCPLKIKIFDKEVIGVLSLNTLTLASHRGQGIFTKLAEDTYDYVKETAMFCFGMPNQNSYKGFINKLGFINIGAIPLFIKPIKPSKMVKEFSGFTWLSHIARPFDWLFASGKFKNNHRDYKIIEITEENITLMDRFWDKIRNKYQVMMVRDSKFIKWRYLEMPLREYHLYMVLKKGEPVAFAAGRIMNVANMTCGMLADFLVTPDAEEAGKMLIKYMQKKFIDKGTSLMGCLMRESTQEGRLLKRNLFFICPKTFEPQPFPIIFRLFDKSLENTGILDFNKWFFTMGDYDVI